MLNSYVYRFIPRISTDPFPLQDRCILTHGVRLWYSSLTIRYIQNAIHRQVNLHNYYIPSPTSQQKKIRPTYDEIMMKLMM